MLPTSEQRAYVEAERARGLSPLAIAETLRSHHYAEPTIAALLPEVAGVVPSLPPPPPTTTVVWPSFVTLVGQAIRRCVARLDVVAILLTLSVIISALAYDSDLSERSAGLQLAGSLALLFVTLFFYISIFAAVRAFVMHGQESLEQSFSWILSRRFFSVLWVSLLSTLVMATSFILLIIPAMVVAVYLLFSLTVFAREDVRGLGALVRSTLLVQGNWWQVLWRYLVMCLMVMVPVGILQGVTSALVLSEITVEVTQAALGSVGSLLIMAFVVVMYETLVAVRPSFDGAAHGGLRRLYATAAAFGLVALPLIIILGGIILWAVLSAGPQ